MGKCFVHPKTQEIRVVVCRRRTKRMKKVSPQEGCCVVSEFSGITGLVREEAGVSPRPLPLPPKGGEEIGSQVQAGGKYPRSGSCSQLSGPSWDTSTFTSFPCYYHLFLFMLLPKYHH